MSQQLQIDDKGFRNMMQVLQKKTGASYRDVVRAITREILTNAAMKTKQTSAKAVRLSVEKILRKPMEIPPGVFIGRTRAGRVWFNGRGWDKRKNWLLVHSDDGSGFTISKSGKKVPGAIRGKRAQTGVQLSAKLHGEVSNAIAEANRKRAKAMQKLNERRGSSKATWLYLMRQLKMQPTRTQGLKQAMKANLHPNNAATLNAMEQGNNEKFEITVSSKSRSALSPKGGDGIRAFRNALQGKVKEFKTASEKDLEGYFKRFAARHGFELR
jgi:hypothetical protein